MPSKKKKYNARFPPARIKKIMQSDEEVGKVAQAVPVIISRALELFVESLLKKAETVTHSRNAKTLTPSHLKQCIMGDERFDFLKHLVQTVPDVAGDEEGSETPRSASVSSTGFTFPPPSSSTSVAAIGGSGIYEAAYLPKEYTTGRRPSSDSVIVSPPHAQYIPPQGFDNNGANNGAGFAEPHLDLPHTGVIVYDRGAQFKKEPE